jgi:uncharacterized protein (TIGR03382 family)
LGIGHSPVRDATMQAIPSYGSAARRALSADDQAAVCDVYPPEEPALPASCSPMPHDFSPHCNHTLPAKSDLPREAGCSTSSAPTRGGAPLVLAAALAGGWALRSRRRPRRARAAR